MQSYIYTHIDTYIHTLHYTTLHYITLHLHLHYITLHYIHTYNIWKWYQKLVSEGPPSAMYSQTRDSCHLSSDYHTHQNNSTTRSISTLETTGG